MKKNIISFVLFVSCVWFSLFAEENSSGEFYTYDYELLLQFTESNVLNQEAGFELKMDFTKQMEGSVVYVQDNKFVEPDFGYTIIITKTKKLYSLENPSISGRIKQNGEFYWSGIEETSGALRNILVKGTLKKSKPSERASKEFDGSFLLKDSGTGREQEVVIHDGLYFWEYAQKQDGDFNPWPTIVLPDGTISFKMTLTTRAFMTGIQDLIYLTEHITKGQVKPGSISLYSITETIGNQTGDDSNEGFFYSDTVGSNQLQEKLKNKMNLVIKPNAKKETKNTNAPYWYEANWEDSSDKTFGRGQKKHDDKETAMKLATIAAVTDLISTISIDVQNETQSQESESEKKLYQIVESVAKQNIDYKVVNSHFDEENCIAYVMVELIE